MHRVCWVCGIEYAVKHFFYDGSTETDQSGAGAGRFAPYHDGLADVSAPESSVAPKTPYLRLVRNRKDKIMLTKQNQSRSWPFGIRPLWAALLLLAMLAWTGVAAAQLPMPPSTQFDITGFLQEATVTTPGSPLSGGTLKVNGHVVTVPASTIVILPAAAFTWEELFAFAPAPYGPTKTGLALADTPAPLTTYEVHVVGNRVTSAVGGDQYIAGLINISQQALNSGAGFINFIDYATGEMRVGGLIGSATTGTRVRINDPFGRFGRLTPPTGTPVPDQRFSVDDANPTIISATGFPMCVPRFAPPTLDALCPQTNRLQVGGVYQGAFTMADPGITPSTIPPAPLDPRIQAPFEVGDFVNFAGTLVKDAVAPTTGPWPGTAGTYISAHTIVNNIAIYTTPGTDPAYVMVEVTLLGVGGVTIPGVGEAVIRTRFEGMTTDVDASNPAQQRNIHLYGVDVAPDGTTSDRDWGTIGVDPGPPLGAVKGRWRFRPPCTAVGTPTQKDCVAPVAGVFLPATREVRAVIEGLQSQDPANPSAVTSANGIFYGQYHAPIGEYIFPENVPGVPPPPNNFETMPFLACGGYTSSGGTLAGVLTPWPGDLTPAVCAGAGFPQVSVTATPSSVLVNSPVTLTATVGGTLPINVVFSKTSGPAGAFNGPATVVVNSPANTASVTFTPSTAVGTPLVFAVTASNGILPIATATVTVPVVAQTDTVVITSVEYRTGQQRLTVNATVTPVTNQTLTLQPYIATDGTTVPGGTLTNNGGGVYSITKVGVKQPAAGPSIKVTSSGGGSATSAITRLRQ